MKPTGLLIAVVSFTICANCFFHMDEVYMFKAAYVFITSFIGVIGVLFLIDSFEMKWQD